jgi:Flp pilus assembly protein TadB
MAQTRRKRQTKHRGNAAGVIEARGRTGRPLSAEEKKRSERDRRREERLNRKPTLKSSVQMALLAGVFIFVVQVISRHSASGIVAAVVTSLFAILLYIGLGYYMQLWLWRRRMAKKQAAVTRR